MDDHGGLILARQMAEGDVGDRVDHVFPQRVVERTICGARDKRTCESSLAAIATPLEKLHRRLFLSFSTS